MHDSSLVSISTARSEIKDTGLWYKAKHSCDGMSFVTTSAGHDTKIFMNSTQPPSKRSRIERSVDHIIFFMFGLLFSMCLTGCIYFAWWTIVYMPRHWYLAAEYWFNEPGVTVPIEYDGSKPGIVAVTNFITSFILYGELTPYKLCEV